MPEIIIRVLNGGKLIPHLSLYQQSLFYDQRFLDFINSVIMEESRKVAVFLDEAKAQFIFIKDGFARIGDTIKNDFEAHPRHRGEGSNQARFGTDPYHGSNNEFRKHRQEKAARMTFFKELTEILKGFDEILLFGPGETKKELRNQLHEQQVFKGKIIDVQTSDYLSDKQLLELVREYFSFIH